MARNVIFLVSAALASSVALAESGCLSTIDCEGYRPSYGSQDGCRFFGQAEFHYFYGSESELNPIVRYQTADVGIIGTPGSGTEAPVVDSIPQRFVNLPASWDAGFRIGAGFLSGCSSLQIDLNWSFFQNESHVISTAPFIPPSGENFYNQNLQLLTSIYDSNEDFDQQVSCEWALRLNRLDLTSSFRYCLSPMVSFSPRVGISGFWSDTNFANTVEELDVTSFSTAVPIISATRRTVQENSIWGGGFFTGLDSNFFIGRGMSIYSNLELSLYWGRDRFRQTFEVRAFTYSDTGSTLPLEDSSFTFKFDSYGMQPVLALSLGLAQSSEWCEGRYQSTAQIGWEHQVWFGLNERYSYTEALILMPNAGDLMMGGFVVRGRFDF